MAMNSPLANLASRTTPETVRAAVPAGVNNGQAVNFSGQYLYDRLIESQNGEEVTRMDIVRSAIKQVDVASWKKALAEMVALAKEHGTAKHNTAKTMQTTLRAAYGSLRFATDALRDLEVDPEKVGINLMAKAGPAALKAKNIRWDGTPLPTKEQKDEQTIQREATSLLKDLQKANPIQRGESLKDWQSRIMGMLDEAQMIYENNQLEQRIDIVARQLVKQHPDIAGAISARILEVLQELEKKEQEDAIEEQRKEMEQGGQVH